jgi:hypothetical protein
MSMKHRAWAGACAVAIAAGLGGAAMAQATAHRFAPLTPDMMTPEQKAVPVVKKAIEAGTYNPNGFDAVLLRNPGLQDAMNVEASKVYPVAAGLFFGKPEDRTTIPPGLMEIGILMLSHEWDFPAMFPSHGPLALKQGLSHEMIDALQRGKRPAHMKPDEAAVYDFSAALIKKHAVSDALFARTRQYLSERAMVDFTTTIGLYMTSITLLKMANIASH